MLAFQDRRPGMLLSNPAPFGPSSGTFGRTMRSLRGKTFVTESFPCSATPRMERWCRTALGVSEGQFDLNEAKVRADTVLSREFDAYSRFVDWIRSQQKTPNRLLLEMPGYVREMTRG